MPQSLIDKRNKMRRRLEALIRRLESDEPLDVTRIRAAIQGYSVTLAYLNASRDDALDETLARMEEKIDSLSANKTA